MNRSLFTLLRALPQLGLRPVLLNGLYRTGLKLGVFSIHPPSAYAVPLAPLFPPLQILDDPLPEAEEILAGKIRLFGGEPVPLRLTPSAPLRPWTACESLPASGDIKFVWEPARFGFVFPLARAYQRSGDQRFAAAFWRYFDQFQAANPPYFGENWISGQEVGLRLMAFCWAGQFLTPNAETAPLEPLRRLSESIAAHADRIPPTLLYARAQNNNHLLTEAAALFTAGLALPTHPRAARWRALGHKWLTWCFDNQFDEEGEYIQHSTNYHRLALQTAIWIFEIAGGQFDRFIPILTRATRWLEERSDPQNGLACNLGANDGANLFPSTSQPFQDFRPALNAARRLFAPAQPPPAAREFWAHLRVKRYTSRPSHADHLHLDLWWRGLNLACDPGTYAYNAPPPWDNALTTALVHNTLTVDDHDQMTRAGRFLYLDWGASRWLDERTAESDAYARLGIWHRRRLELLPNGWRIHDRVIFLRPGQPHHLRLHWLFADWPWQLTAHENSAALVLQSLFGPIFVKIQAALPLQVSLVRAGETLFPANALPAEPMRGWVAPTYAHLRPALSLALTTTATQSVEMATECRVMNGE